MHRTLHLLVLLLLASAAPAGTQERIDIGQTVRGELTDEDASDGEGKRVDTWEFTAAAGTTYVITLETEYFDAYLWAGPRAGGGCEPCSWNNNGFGRMDARIVLPVERAGPQLIRVTTVRPREIGAYTLKVRLDPPVLLHLGTPRDTSAAADLAGYEGAVLPAGDAVASVLRAGDALTDAGAYQDAWRYTARDGEVVVFTMSSRDFDPVLRVGQHLNGRRLELGSDDDGGGGTDSRLLVTFPEAGEYEVHATSLNRGQTGAYALQATRMRAGAPPAGSVAWEGCVSGTLPRLPRGDEVEAALEEGDCEDGGARFDAYRYAGSAGERVIFLLSSRAFDTVLRVGTRERGAWRELAMNDDGSAGTDSELAFTLPADGEYEVRAGSYRAGEGGPYELFARARLAEPGDTAVSPGVVGAGRQVEGRLDEGDARGEGGAFVDEWMLEGREGNTLTIDLRSAEFDPVLRVMVRAVDGAWRELASDDDGGEGMDSRLTLTLPRAGGYRIQVTTYRPGDRGAYTLAVRN